MTAPVTSRQDWDDLITALYGTTDDIAALREAIAERNEPDEEEPMTDHNPDAHQAEAQQAEAQQADADQADADLDEQHRDRVHQDYHADGRLDGDYDDVDLSDDDTDLEQR